MKKSPLKPGRPLTRTASLARGKPVKKVNPKRALKAWRRAFGSPDRVEWIAGLRSVANGFGPCVNHHVRSRGAGGTYRDIVPLTAREHEWLHAIGRETFERLTGVSLSDEATRIAALWEARDADVG